MRTLFAPLLLLTAIGGALYLATVGRAQRRATEEAFGGPYVGVSLETGASIARQFGPLPIDSRRKPRGPVLGAQVLQDFLGARIEPVTEIPQGDEETRAVDSRPAGPGDAAADGPAPFDDPLRPERE